METDNDLNKQHSEFLQEEKYKYKDMKTFLAGVNLLCRVPLERGW